VVRGRIDILAHNTSVDPVSNSYFLSAEAKKSHRLSGGTHAAKAGVAALRGSDGKLWPSSRTCADHSIVGKAWDTRVADFAAHISVGRIKRRSLWCSDRITNHSRLLAPYDADRRIILFEAAGSFVDVLTNLRVYKD